MLLLVQLCPANRERGPIRRVLEQGALGGAERASRRLREAKEADGRPLDHERDLTPPILVHGRRLALAFARDLPHLPSRGADDHRLVELVADLNLGRLDPEQLGEPLGQLRKQLVELEGLERGREVLERAQPLGDRLGLRPRGLLEQQIGAVLLGAAANGQVDPLREQQRVGEFRRFDRGSDHADPHLDPGARHQPEVDARTLGIDRVTIHPGGPVEDRRQILAVLRIAQLDHRDPVQLARLSTHEARERPVRADDSPLGVEHGLADRGGLERAAQQCF